MNSCFSCAFVSLAMGIDDIFLSGENAIPFIIIMSVFVFALLLFKKVIRVPKRLFISSFISYILMLFIVLWFYLAGKCFPDIFLSSMFLKIITFLCILVILPNFFFFNLMEELINLPHWLYSWPILFQTILYLMTFIMNTLYIFWIIRLILFIKHKILSRKNAAVQ